jgi:hypothetical protein
MDVHGRRLVLESAEGLDLLTGPTAAYGRTDRLMHLYLHTQSAPICSELVDRMIELYCDWRTACSEVQAAYERFRRTSARDRAAAFAAYAAALDQEQCTCESYADQVRLIEARLTGDSGPIRRREPPLRR